MGGEQSSRPAPVDRARARGEVEVEPQRVDAGPLVGRAPAGAEVVVDVEHRRDVEDRGDHPVQRGPAEAGDDVGVADVEAEADGRGVESADERPDRERVRRHGLRPRIDRGEVLEREPDADVLGGPAEDGERAGLGEQPVLGAAALDDHLRVVDDLLGAALGGVGEGAGQRPVRRPVAGGEVAGGVEDGAERCLAQRRRHRPGVADAAPGVGEDPARGRRELHPAEPGRLDLGEQLLAGPPLVRDVEAQPVAGRICDAHDPRFPMARPKPVKDP